MGLLSPGGAGISDWYGAYQEVACWDSVIMDLGRRTWIGSLVYYEVENPSDPGFIAMDWVIVYVSTDVDGPWKLVFYWGDSDAGNNGNIPSGVTLQESDSQRISFGDLYNQTGIQINVGGTYRYVMISAPPRCDDPAQVGGIDILQ
jgi:hypothetical protein